MSKNKLVRKAYLATIYAAECNHNLMLDYPRGLTSKAPIRHSEVIKRNFSDVLNLDSKTGASLFWEYSSRNYDRKGNDFWKFLVKEGLDDLKIDLVKRTCTTFGTAVPIFSY